MNWLENWIVQHSEQQAVDNIVTKNLSCKSLYRKDEIGLFLISQVITVAAKVEDLPHIVNISTCSMYEVLNELWVGELGVSTKIADDFECLLFLERMPRVFLE